MKTMKKLIALLLILACLGGTSVPALATYTTGTVSHSVQLVSSKKKSSGKNVWIAPNHGKKYHRKSCRTLKRSNNLKKMKLSAAKKAGYKRCKVCKP